MDLFVRGLAAPIQMLTDLNQVYAERGAGGKLWLTTINGTIQERNQLFGRCGGMVTVEIWLVLQRGIAIGAGRMAQATVGSLPGLGCGFLVPTRMRNLLVEPGMGEQTFGDLIGLWHSILMRASGRRRIAKHQLEIRETT
jgi:hypothetical protein